jgi:hypothetical protein
VGGANIDEPLCSDAVAGGRATGFRVNGRRATGTINQGGAARRMSTRQFPSNEAMRHPLARLLQWVKRDTFTASAQYPLVLQ